LPTSAENDLRTIFDQGFSGGSADARAGSGDGNYCTG
jgi:hypothetical protein